MLLSTGPPSFRSKLLHLLITAAVISLFLHTRRLYNTQAANEHPSALELAANGGHTPEEQYLNRVASECSLTNDSTWLAWRIEHTQQLPEWTSYTDIHDKFLHHAPKLVNTEEPKWSDIQVKKVMQLPAHNSPRPGQVDASDLLLGVSTTYSRVASDDYSMVTTWARWLTNGRRESNGASLIVMLDQASESHVADVDRKLQASGIDAYVTTTEEPMSMARRYYELARILKTFGANLAANGQQKRFFGLIEDDIFFPSLSYLLDRLLSYNTDDKLYFGLPSERDDWEMDGERITTHGGGAIFLTKSAITEVPRLPCFGRDEDGLPIRAKHWDVLIKNCLAKHIDLQMHVLPGFFSPQDDGYTPDINSYETGLQPLLLHHTEERHALNINKAHLVTDVCGEACFMQRYIFKDNFVLINGVSITEYPDGLTFGEQPDPETAESRRMPTQDKLVLEDDEGDRTIRNLKGRKNVWKLADSAVGKNGAVWQAYVKKGSVPYKPEAVEPDSIDSVIVLVWEKGDTQRRR